jgi:succinate dehydrogenase/fumarate reductase flavoprotein subunit
VAQLAVARRSRTLVTHILQAGGRATGVVGLDRGTGVPCVLRAGAVVLAAGDCSFRGNYVGTGAATGDALRLAFDAGVRLANLEFLAVNTAPPAWGFEGTGVVLRWGGRLRDAQGRPFMHRHHPDGDAAEIGALVQAMAREVRAGNGPPFSLDVAWPMGHVLRRIFAGMGGFMPRNLEKLRRLGIDPFTAPQTWMPAVQSLRGGVRTDIDGASDLPGLFAAGLSQAFDPGLFNGWSTMRAMWSGEHAGRAAARFAATAGQGVVDGEQAAARVAEARAALARRGGLDADELLARLQRTIFPFDVSILKHGARLGAALRAVEELRAAVPALVARDPHALCKVHETASMVLVAELFLRASLARRESRGDHCREDFPARDDRHGLAWTTLRRDAAGRVALDADPVPFARYPLRPAAELAV